MAFADRDAYPTLSDADLSAGHFEVILAPTEPYPWHLRHVDELSQYAPTHLVDGQDLFWWGTRTPAAIVRVAEAIGKALDQTTP